MDCLRHAASGGANPLEEEERLPPPGRKCDAERDQLRRSLRYYTVLELANRSAADALERFYQLAEIEARTDVLRRGFRVIDPLLAKAKNAKSQNIRYPLEPADLERQRSQLLAQLEQAELGSRLVNLDLKRRLGLPSSPPDERLWPSGDFTIDSTPINPDEAATAAVADRPELRGLRALQAGLTPNTLPDVRDLLRAATPLAAPRPTALKLALVTRRLLHRDGPDPAALAELEVRRKQITDFTAERERMDGDEARAAAMALNAQLVRASRARDRMRSWDAEVAEAVKKRNANQPGAELLEAQVRLEWLRAKSELIAEVAACHQARVRLRAAMGWLAWEAIGTGSSTSHR